MSQPSKINLNDKEKATVSRLGIAYVAFLDFGPRYRPVRTPIFRTIEQAEAGGTSLVPTFRRTPTVTVLAVDRTGACA